jgi:hypothetical protein
LLCKRKQLHLAVVHFALDEVGLDAGLGQGFGSAGARGPATDHRHAERSIEYSAIPDSLHRDGVSSAWPCCAEARLQGCRGAVQAGLASQLAEGRHDCGV